MSSILKQTKKQINLQDIDLIIFDFDGVFTNNKVYLSEDGKESVVCNRSDGMAIKALHGLSIKMIVLSTEKNKVVKYRAKKLNLECHNGISNKEFFLKRYIKKKGISFSNCLYVGNDLNDYDAMKCCKYKVCPSDSHNEIIKISNYLINVKGGDGVIRELLEKTFKINLLKLNK